MELSVKNIISIKSEDIPTKTVQSSTSENDSSFIIDTSINLNNINQSVNQLDSINSHPLQDEFINSTSNDSLKTNTLNIAVLDTADESTLYSQLQRSGDNFSSRNESTIIDSNITKKSELNDSKLFIHDNESLISQNLSNKIDTKSYHDESMLSKSSTINPDSLDINIESIKSENTLTLR